MPISVCIDCSHNVLFVLFLQQVLSNELHNDTVRVHADVKSLFRLENVGYLHIFDKFFVLPFLVHFAFDSMTSHKGRSLSRRLDLTDKSKRKSIIRTQRSNGGRISTCICMLIFLYFVLNCVYIYIIIIILEFKLEITFIHVIYRRPRSFARINCTLAF